MILRPLLLLGALSAAAVPGPLLGQELRPVPVPVLDRLSEGDRETLREVRSELDALLEGTVPADSSALEAAYGDVGEHYLAHDLMEPARVAFENARRLDPSDPLWPYFLGVLHFREGRLEEAREALETVSDLEPDGVPTLLRLGEIYLDSGRLDEAEDAFRRASELNSRSAMAHYGLGRVAQERDLPEEAIERFERALALQPGATSIHHSLGLVYRSLGDRDRAREHLLANRHDPVRFHDPRVERLSSLLRGSRPHVKAGNQAVARGDLDAAREHFARAVEADPTDRLAHYNLGRILVQIGDPDDGIAAFRRALELDPEYRDAHFNLASALARRGEWEAASRHYGRAAEIDPADHLSRLQQALALEKTGRVADARELFELLAERSPGASDEIRAASELRLGTAAAEAGDAAEAESRLRKAARLDATHAPTFAGWLGRRGRFGEAAEWYEKAIDSGRDDAEVRFGQAMALLLADREPEAKRALERAVASFPGEVGLRHALARLLASARSPEVREADRALELALEVFEIQPSIPHAETVAMAHAAGGDFDEAVAWQERVAQRSEDVPRAMRQAILRRLESYRKGDLVLAPWAGGGG